MIIGFPDPMNTSIASLLGLRAQATSQKKI